MACKSVKIGLYFKFLFSEEDTLVLENLIQDYDAFKYKYVPNLVSAKGYWIGMNTYTYKYAAENGLCKWSKYTSAQPSMTG